MARHLEVTPPPSHEHRCLRNPRGLLVVAGTVRAIESSGEWDGIFVDDKDKGAKTQARRTREPARVSRVSAGGTSQEWTGRGRDAVP